MNPSTWGTQLTASQSAGSQGMSPVTQKAYRGKGGPPELGQESGAPSRVEGRLAVRKRQSYQPHSSRK